MQRFAPATLLRAGALAERRRARDDVLAGLRETPKRLPARLLDDATAADLRKQIRGHDDYYPERTELRLLDAHLPAIAAEVGFGARVVELGEPTIGTTRLLDALDHPTSYARIDVADQRSRGRTLLFIPGATIDRYSPFEAVALLASLRRFAMPMLLLSADGTRDRDALQRAYHDSDGRTAELSRYALVRLNRERGTRIQLDAFSHRAVWNDQHCRVELQLVSLRDQQLTIGADIVRLGAGESIVTAHIYKHELPAMRGLLLAAGWRARHVFTAEEQPMRLWLCVPRGE